MTTTTAAAPRALRPSILDRLASGPAEGWLSPVLLVVLVLAMAMSIDDAAWVRGRGELTDFLPWMAGFGVLAGFVGVKLGWSRWLAHLVGAVWAAVLVPIIVGSIMVADAGSIGAWFQAAAESARLAYIDLAVLGRSVTTQYGHFLLVLGWFCWATGQYAASAVFRDHRPLDAAIALGFVLVVNMSLTLNDQLGYLVLFSLAVLFLLIRSHVFDEQTVWLRRRIGDPTELPAFYLRRGSVFVVLAVAVALVLTASASSNPLAGAWSGLTQRLIEVGQGMERFLPTGGASRGVGVAFGDTAVITGRWVSSPALALTVEVEPSERQRFYWRAAAYDTFELQSWRITTSGTERREAGEELLAGTIDAATMTGRRAVDFTVRREALAGSSVLSPQAPYSVDRPSSVDLVDGQFMGSVNVDPDEFTVTALVPLTGDRDPGGRTENRLRAAGTDYPQAILDRYLDVPDGAIGPDARLLLAAIVAQAPSQTPYDLAKTMQDVLKGPAFTYQADVTQLDTEGRSVVETFAHFRVGYCEYYASTMAVLLREIGVPTRLARGFLPGERELGTGIERILMSSAHAWVEVYFPGYGWVDFDPTGGGVAQLAPLPSGRPETSPTPRPTDGPPLPTSRDGGIEEPDDAPTDGVPGGTIRRPTDPAPFIALGIILLAVIAALAAAVWYRGPRGPIEPEGVWRRIGHLAGRFGFAPRPTETAYEYAGSLGEVLPEARPELLTVADARVEVAYGRRTLGAERLSALRQADRRLRVALLRLALRRRQRRH